MPSRQRGVIVNISSGAADIPLQLVAVYSSTKVCWHHLRIREKEAGIRERSRMEGEGEGKGEWEEEGGGGKS